MQAAHPRQQPRGRQYRPQQVPWTFRSGARTVLHVIGRAGPSSRAAERDERRRPAGDWFWSRFGDAGSRTRRGYATWLFVGLVFGIPETWAGIGNPPWPGVSETIGHLEALWSPVAVIVVALVVFIAFQVIRYPPGRADEVVVYHRSPGRGRVRTANGRLTRLQAEHAGELPVYLYFPLALGVVAAGSVIAASVSSDKFVLGDTIYGLFALFLLIIPNALAFWFARDVPFPTLCRTVADLERRWPPAAMVIVAGLIILMLHIVFFPWPDIFPRLAAG